MSFIDNIINYFSDNMYILLKLYSIIELFIKKKYYEYFPLTFYKIEAIKDNNVVNLLTEYDFILYYSLTNKNNYLCKICSNSNFILIEKSNITFLSFTYNNKEIKLSNYLYDFYVVDNILNEKFMIYFLNKYYAEIEQNNTLITIFDAEFKIVTFDFSKEQLIFHKDSYEIQTV
jgi:hypothetical protein